MYVGWDGREYEDAEMDGMKRDAAEELLRARIKTLETALHSSLVVMREWINRAECGMSIVEEGDMPRVKSLYGTLLAAYLRDKGMGD